jgi:hypothetical protein
MKRLRDLPPEDPTRERAHALLAALTPLDASEARKRRVRRAIEARALASRRRFRPHVLALAALLVFSGSTLTLAQTGLLQRVIARVARIVHPPPAPERDTVAPRPPKPRSPRTHAHVPPVAQPAAPSAADAASAQQTPEAQKAPEKRVPSAKLLPREHAELVRRAVKALRRDQDPRLAARLLEEAQAKSPHGALAEEVMALRVEAAQELGDARSTRLARAYLARYPQGRYRSQVERALPRE